MAVVLLHSVADARAIGAEPTSTLVVLPDPSVWIRQVTDSSKDVLLAMENYVTVRREADTWKVPVTPSWSTVVLWARLHGWRCNMK
jgi:hypothetical protein